MTDAANQDAQALSQMLDSFEWRIKNLYWIITKDDDGADGDGLVVKFVPNRAQRRLLARLHSRNIVLKARQLGFSTLVCILWLDTALFSKEPMRLGIIAHEREAAEALFRDKILFAYNHLPDEIKAACPLTSKTKTEIVFGHNDASIRVATSMRSGTMHRLHVSEYGKIAAKYPAKAIEVMTGSIPSVPLDTGMLIVESTAEGQDGPFYAMTRRAMEVAQSGLRLSKRDYRLHFFAWWEDERYTIDDAPSVVMTQADLIYFAKVEAIIGRKLTRGQRLWWKATCEADFNGEAPLMWQEYPSYPAEAFQVSTDGCYYAKQVARARLEGRIDMRLPITQAPVYTFWDLGRGDMTAIWLMQHIDARHRFIWYYEESGEELDHFADWLMQRRLIYATHFLPHDADTKRLGKNVDTNQSLRQMLEDLMPGHDFQVVPRVTNLQSGIQATRAAFRSAWFHGEHCAQGIARLSNYRKKWDKVRGRWMEEPEHNDDSHGADAFRQFGQALEAGERFTGVARRAVARPASVDRLVQPARRRWRGGGGSAMSA